MSEIWEQLVEGKDGYREQEMKQKSRESRSAAVQTICARQMCEDRIRIAVRPLDRTKGRGGIACRQADDW